jgi:hypothetical protein
MFGLSLKVLYFLPLFDTRTSVPVTNPPADYPPVLVSHCQENRSGATITFAWNSFVVSLPASVTGSSNTEPPWTVAFATLNSTPLQFSVAGGNRPLFDKTRIQYEVYYSSQTSFEKWTNGTQSPMRTKVTPTYLHSDWYIYPLDAPVGGGGGGVGG